MTWVKGRRAQAASTQRNRGLMTISSMSLPPTPRVLDPLAGALMHPGRDHPAVRTDRLHAVGGGDDPAATQRQITGCEHLVAVEVEHHRDQFPKDIGRAADSGQGQV